MIRTTLRLALRTSWLGDRAAVLRSTLLTIAGALAVTATLSVAGAGLMLGRVADRAEARAFVTTDDGDEVAAGRHVVFDATPDGDQIYIYWWHLRDDRFRIPGLSEDPPVGSWFVSPELARRIAADGMGERFPDASVIGDEGVVHADELIAHRIVGAEAELTDGVSARTDPSAYLGDGADLDADRAVSAALILFALPLLGLLAAAVSVEAVHLGHRIGVLRALGATGATTSLLVAVHTLVAIGPGALAGGVATHLWLAGRTSVPFVGRAVLAGDLRVGPVGVAAAVLVVCLAGCVMATVRPRWKGAGRPTDAVLRRPGWVRVVPLATALAMMAAGSGVLGGQRDPIFLAGFLATSPAAIIALPVLYRATGDALARLPSVLSLLVGRRLTWNARSASRPLLVFGALVVLTPVATAWVDVGRSRTADELHTFEIEPVAVHGELPPAELEALTAQTAAAPLWLVTVEDPGSGEPRASWVADCERLATVLTLHCAPGTFTIEEPDLQGLIRYRAGPAEGPISGTTTMPSGAQIESTLLVSRDWDRTERVVRAHLANRAQPGPPMGYIVNPKHEARVVRWVLGGLAAAAVLCAAAFVLHLVSQSARLARTRGHLFALGTAASRVRRLAAAESGLTVALAGASCIALGAFASWCFVQMNPDARLPVAATALVAAGILLAATLCAVAATIGIRQPEVTTRD